MKKFLTKDIRKAGEAKFSRWKALFSNFDFDVEHIKGEENSLPDFLTREYIQDSTKDAQVMMIVTEWDPNQQQEVLRSICKSKSWSEYNLAAPKY